MGAWLLKLRSSLGDVRHAARRRRRGSWALGGLDGVQVARGLHGAEALSPEWEAGGPPELIPSLTELFAHLEQTLQLDLSGIAVGTLAATRALVRHAMTEAFEQAGIAASGDRLTSDFGIVFDWSNAFEPSFELLPERLSKSGTSGKRDLLAFLGGDGGGDPSGLLDGLESAIERTVDSLVASLGKDCSLGLQLDRSA